MVEIISLIVTWAVPIVAGIAAIIIAIKLVWGSEKSTKEAKDNLGRWLAGMVALVAGMPIVSNFFTPLFDGIKKIMQIFLPGAPNLDLMAKTAGQIFCIGLLISAALATVLLIWGTETAVLNSKKRATSLLLGIMFIFVVCTFGDKLFGMLKNPIPDAAKKLKL